VRLFALYIDNQRYSELVQLFTEDCVFERPGVKVSGRDGLLKEMQDRPTPSITKHICGSPLFLAVTPLEASAVTEMTFYRGETAALGPPDFDGPAAIAEYYDRFRHTEDGWRIAQRNVVIVMVRRR
jgi:hypothetical protein